MDPTIAVWIIQASIIAAGIIFAIYNFLPSMLGGLLQVRTEPLGAQGEEEDLSRIKLMMTRLKKLKDIPWLISRGLLATFGLYLLSAIFCVLFLLDLLGILQLPVDSALWLFLIATVFFVFIGILALKSIKDIVDEQLRELQKERYRKEKQSVF